MLKQLSYSFTPFFNFKFYFSTYTYSCVNMASAASVVSILQPNTRSDTTPSSTGIPFFKQKFTTFKPVS